MNELERLLAEGSKRPWRFTGRAYEGDDNVALLDADGVEIVTSGCLDENRLEISDADAVLICEAVNGLADLVVAEAELRREWWLNHGHHFDALYGDDGEMQCTLCRCDYKRDPIDRLRAAVRAARFKRAALERGGTVASRPGEGAAK